MQRVTCRIGSVVIAASLVACSSGDETSSSSGKRVEVRGAVYTTVNQKIDGGGHCKNGNPPVNCNIYDRKEHVWLNGGPESGGLKTPGDYFFAVLVPGGQPNPNDGGPKNLSDDFDAYTNRTFTITATGDVLYTGTHDFYNGPKRPLIRLFPYADTTNPGGVYIMAVCSLGDGYPVVPSRCKYDAFKVQKGKVQVQAFLSGLKYRDDNKNGQYDTEPGLAGWAIQIKGSDGTNVTQTTNASGEWSYTIPLHAPVASTTTYTICEVQQAGWRQTGNTVDQSVPTGGATVALASFCYAVAVPNDAPVTVDALNFGNLPQGTISGLKYYDADQSGAFDPAEVGIAGWKITQSDGTTSVVFATVSNGTFALTLDPGTYTLTEVQATNGWKQTGNTVEQFVTTGGATVTLAGFAYTIVVPATAPSTVTGLNFGNVCEVAPGGHTMGFWSNPNGQALITAGDLAALCAMNLRNADGTDFDPATKEEYRDWLLSANAVNMAYMLSAQLTATYLSSQHGFTNTSVLVNGMDDVQDVIDAANAALGQDGYTPSGDPNRDAQTLLKNILDDVNNGKAFVQPAITYCPAPVFP